MYNERNPVGVRAMFLAVALLSVTFLYGCTVSVAFDPQVPDDIQPMVVDSEIVEPDAAVESETVVDISTGNLSGGRVIITDSPRHGVRIDIPQ